MCDARSHEDKLLEMSSVCEPTVLGLLKKKLWSDASVCKHDILNAVPRCGAQLARKWSLSFWPAGHTPPQSSCFR